MPPYNTAMMKSLVVATLLALATWGWSEDLEPVVKLHVWGVEGDLNWRPAVLIPGTQTTFTLGADALYKTWNDFRNPLTNKVLTSTTAADAAVSEFASGWFVEMSQGLAGQTGNAASDHRLWASPNLVEVYGAYRGTLLDTLSSGANFATSSQPDRNGYLQTAFLGGIDLNMLTKTDEHNLRSGFILEGAAETAPPGFQSVTVNYNRLTGQLIWFQPVYDANPDSRLNTISVLLGANLVFDHLWGGGTIPTEAQQLVGGRAWDGLLAFSEGVGGGVRGIESGRFDGNDKTLANLDVRVNLPGFDVPDFVRNLSPLPLDAQVIPGIVFFYDYGAWQGLAGLDPGTVTTAGLGLFVTVGQYGSLAVYMTQWLTGGSLYNNPGLPITASLGMQF